MGSGLIPGAISRVASLSTPIRVRAILQHGLNNGSRSPARYPGVPDRGFFYINPRGSRGIPLAIFSLAPRELAGRLPLRVPFGVGEVRVGLVVIEATKGAAPSIAHCLTSDGVNEQHKRDPGDPYQRNGRSSSQKAVRPVLRIT